MFCSNCGAKIPDDSRFCPKCGHPVQISGNNDANDSNGREEGADSVSSPFEAAQQSIKSVPENVPEPEDHKRKVSSKVIIPLLIAAAAIAILCIAAITNTGRNKSVTTITESGSDEASQNNESSDSIIVKEASANEPDTSSTASSIEQPQKKEQPVAATDSKTTNNKDTFEVDPTVKNSDFSDGYVQIYDMVFQCGEAETFRDAVSTIEKSSIFSRITNTYDVSDDASDYHDYSNTITSESGCDTVQIVYYIDEKESFTIHLSMISDDDSPVNLMDGYVEFVTIPQTVIDGHPVYNNPDIAPYVYFARGIDGLARIDGNSFTYQELTELFNAWGYPETDFVSSDEILNCWDNEGTTELGTFIDLNSVSNKPAVKDFREYSDGGIVYSDFLYQAVFNPSTEEAFSFTLLPGVFQISYDQTTDPSSSSSADTKEESEAAASVSYDEILPFSSDRLITESDISGLDNQALQTAVNEIYARHGYRFKDPDILAYFEQYDWYHPSIDSSDFNNDVLSRTENENIKFLQEHMQ